MQWDNAESFYGNARQPPELKHYGVKGQKWGIRRYQEENGSYTEEGKIRYGRKSKSSLGKNQALGKATGGLAKGMPKRISGGQRKKGHSDWKPEDAENLSDEELNRRNSRLQREQQYKDATSSKWKKEAKQTAKDWTKEAIKRIFIGTAITLAVAVMTKQYKKAQSNIEQYASHKLSEIRQPSSTRDAIRQAVNNYGQNGRKVRDIYAERSARMKKFNDARSRR